MDAGPVLSPEHPLACWIAEAQREELFQDRWDDGRDASFRAFAAACLTLAGVERLDRAARLALYRDIATRRRRAVLGTIARTAVAPAVIRLLANTEWWHFTADDWTSFLTTAGGAPALVELDTISPLLVRQLADIPAALRRANVFEVLNTLMVPSGRWRAIGTALPVALATRPAVVAAAIRNVRSIGDFWDACHLCTIDCLRPFPLVKTIEPHLTVLEPLSSIEVMEAEAVRMDNCLRKLVWRAATGCGLYFRLRNGPAVTAELRKTAKGWQPGDIKGPHNQAVDEELAVRVRQELVSLASHLPMASDASGQNALDCLCDFARANFPPAEIDRATEALLTIRGRTRAWTDGAYTIFSIEGGAFVQFMSSRDGDEYLCEIASHKFVPERSRYLAAAAVDIIEGSGFLWPAGRENFLRWFPLAGPDDCRRLAELSLGLLAGVFGHTAEKLLKVKTVLPRPTNASTGAPYHRESKEADTISPLAADTALKKRSRLILHPGDIIITERPDRTEGQ